MCVSERESMCVRQRMCVSERESVCVCVFAHVKEIQ